VHAVGHHVLGKGGVTVGGGGDLLEIRLPPPPPPDLRVPMVEHIILDAGR